MPDNKVVYSVQTPDGHTEQWDQQTYDQYHQKLYKKYPEAQVARVSTYNPEDDDKNETDIFQVTADGRTESWSRKQFDHYYDALTKKYPEAQVVKVSDMTDRYWRPKLQEAQAAFDEFNAANGKAMRDYESAIKDAGKGASRSGLSGNQQYVKEHYDEYENLRKQREALGAAVYNNPIVSRGRKMAFDNAMKLHDEYLENAKYAESGEERRDWKRAAKLQRDAAEMFSAPSIYSGTEGKSGFSKYVDDYLSGSVNTFSDRDFWTRGLSQITRDMDLYSIQKKVQDAEKEKGRELDESDYDRILTNGEKAQLFAAYNLAYAQADEEIGRGKDLPSAFRAGQGAAESLGFMAEFMLGTGIMNVAGKKLLTKGSQTAFKKWLGEALMSNKAVNTAIEKGIIPDVKRTALQKLGRSAAQSLVKGAGHTVVQPLGLWSNVAQKMNEENDEGELNGFWRGFGLGLADTFIENWSESFGNTIDTGFEALGGGISKLAGGAKMRTDFGKAARWALQNNFTQRLAEAGFNGFLAEMMEEWAGNAVRLATGIIDKDEFKQFASIEQQLEMAASFAPMSLIGLAGQAGGAITHHKKFKEDAEKVKAILLKNGVSQPEIDALFGQKFSTSSDIAAALAPYAQRVINSEKGNSQQDYNTILKFAGEFGANAFNDAVTEIKNEEKRNEMRDAISATTGQFWRNVEDTENLDANFKPVQTQQVRVIQDENGSRQYIISSTADEAGNREYATIDEDGSHGFITDKQLEEGQKNGTLTYREMGLAPYLQERVDEVRTNEEAQRMNRELQAKLQAVQQRIAEDKNIDLGTPEAPRPAVVVPESTNPRGVTVVGKDENGEFTETLTWQQVGNHVGMPIIAKTDAELEEEVAEEMLKTEQRKEKYNRIPVGTPITVMEESGEDTAQPVQYRFAHAIYDENEDFVRVYVTNDAGEILTDAEGNEVWFPDAMIPGLEAVADNAIAQEGKAGEIAQEVKDGEIQTEITPAVAKYTDENGNVDRDAFKNNEPEEWAKWNDEQMQDGGADTVQSLGASIKALDKDISAINTKLESEAGENVRANLRTSLEDLTKRRNRLMDILSQYTPAQEPVADVKAVEDLPLGQEEEATAEKSTALSKVPKNKKGEPLFEQAPAEVTAEALLELTGGNLPMAIKAARQTMIAKRDERKKEEKKQVKGKNPVEIIKKEREKAEKIQSIEAEVKYWGEVVDILQEKMARLAEKVEDTSLREPKSLWEAVADWFISMRNKLDKESFMKETGYSDNDMATFFQLWAKKGEGLTVEQLAEYIAESDTTGLIPTDQNGQKDIKAVRDAIIDVFQEASSPSDLYNYTLNANLARRMEEDEYLAGLQEEQQAQEAQAPVVEEEAPVAEEEAPVVEEEALAAEEEAPVVEEQAPVVEQETPAVEEKTPVTEEEVVAEEQAPPAEQKTEEAASEEDMPEDILTEDQKKALGFVQGKTPEQVESEFEATQKAEKEAKRQKKLVKRAEKWKKLIGDAFELLASEADIAAMDETEQNRDAALEEVRNGGHGWYSQASDKAYIYLPNIKDARHLDQKILHEVLTHKGLLHLLGRNGYDRFLDKVWENMSENAKQWALNYYKDNAFPSEVERQRAGADEYLAKVAEGNETVASVFVDNGFWNRAARWLEELINDMVGEGIFDTSVEHTWLGDELMRSYLNLQRESLAKQEKKEEPLTEAQKKSVAFVQGKTPEQVEAEHKSRKIVDWGEKIAGARKDRLSEIARTLDNATEESFAALPLAKAFKRPNTKKLIEEGLISQDEAAFIDAISMLILGSPKPREKKRKWSYERELRVWAKEQARLADTLRSYLNADEEGRTAIIESLADIPQAQKDAADEYRKKLIEWNGHLKPEDIVGNLYSPKPEYVAWRVLRDAGFVPGSEGKVKIPTIETSNGRYYTVEVGHAQIPAYTLEEAIEKAVYLTRVQMGDTDIEHPLSTFSAAATEYKAEPSGEYFVVLDKKRGYGFDKVEFNSKEDAEKYAAEHKDRHAEVHEYQKRVPIKWEARVKHPITGEFTNIGFTFDSREEFRQSVEAEYEKYNDKANEVFASQAEVKKEKKSPVYVAGYYDRNSRSMQYGVFYEKGKGPFATDTLADGFQSKADAEKWLSDNREGIDKMLEDVSKERKEFTFFKDGVAERKGADRRGGRDITGEELGTTFGFRGIQYGNYANDRDRQAALNQAYDSFWDLADLLGVSPKALSLNGTLGLSFGARGSGWANAHYEPAEVVINLTKTRGAGSLAHEWWHAVCNYFARQENVPLGDITEMKPTSMRPELAAAFRKLTDAIDKSDYAKRSRGKGAAYWGSMPEMTARLFAEWAHMKLADAGNRNDFLTRGVDQSLIKLYQRLNYRFYEWGLERRGKADEKMSEEEFAKTPQSLTGMPEPTLDETRQFGPLMQSIFETMEEQKDEESGKTMLFSKQDKKKAPASAVPGGKTPFKATDVTSANGTKIRNNLEEFANDAKNLSFRGKNAFLTLLSDKLEAVSDGSNSRYATFEAKNGVVFTLRLANHNAEVSNFDNREENNGISLVVSRKPNTGILNDGDARVEEFFYSDKDLRKAGNDSYAEIVKSVIQSLYSGEYKDTTGLAHHQEVNTNMLFSKWNAEEAQDIAYFNALESENMAEVERLVGEAAKDAGYTEEQAKSAEPIVYDYDGMVIPLSERFNPGSQDIRFSKAFHGSRADFERFDHSYMGTGEGAQAHGWGTYVAMDYKTARGYAQRLSGMDRYERQLREEELDNLRTKLAEKLNRYDHLQDLIRTSSALDGDKEEIERWGEEAESLKDEFENGALRKNYRHKKLILDCLDASITYAGFDATAPVSELSTIADATMMVNRAGSYKLALDLYKGQEVGEKGVGLYDAYQFLKNTDEDDWISSMNLYSVDIPDDNGDNYMQETAPAQRADLAEIWGKLDERAADDTILYLNLPDLPDFINEYEGKTNEHLYYALSKMLGGKKEASKFLSSMGYAGIKYNGYSDGECAVIFDENDITISDHLRFSRGAETEDEVLAEKLRYSKVTDKDLLDQLNAGKTFKAYRAMAFLEDENGDVEADLGDGKGLRKGFLYSPMATQERDDNGRWKLRQPTAIGEWEQADEHPEKAIEKDGKWVYRLKKPDGSTVDAAYNPYIHTSLIPLNDQFTSAYKRPELVTVEVEVPESELTSGYKAEKAKDAVGKMTWHSGAVAGQLPEGRKREVVLSRYDRPVLVVPNSEVADMIIRQFRGVDTKPFPWNVFTTSLREELKKRGVAFSNESSGKVPEGDLRFSRGTMFLMGLDKEGRAIVNETNDRMNGIQERLTKAEKQEQRDELMEEKAAALKDMYDKLGVQDITVSTRKDIRDVFEKDGATKEDLEQLDSWLKYSEQENKNFGGFHNNTTGKVYIIADDIPSAEMGRLKQLHEFKHLNNSRTKAHYDAAKTGVTTRELEDAILFWTRTDKYSGHSLEYLANEVLAISEELAEVYGANELPGKLMAAGINNQEFINFVQKNIEDGRREGLGLSGSGRDSRDDGNPQGPGGQDGRDLQAGSKEVGKPGSRSDEGSRQADERRVAQTASDLYNRYENQDGSAEYPWVDSGEDFFALIERELPYTIDTKPVFALIDEWRRLDKEDFDEGRRDFSGGEKEQVFDQVVKALQELGQGTLRNTDIRFSKANESQRMFISNAGMAVSSIPMAKATPEQWLKMIEKNGGLKAGEDKWLGLSDWLKASGKKTITKQEVQEFIDQNQIQIEETHYAEDVERDDEAALRAYNDEFNEFVKEGQEAGEENPGEYAFRRMIDRYGDDFETAFDYYDNQDGTFTLDPDTDPIADGPSDAAKYFLDQRREGFDERINKTRLNYTTEGLENKREIALTVPTIAPWKENDQVHFGDAGEGRAVAWVRFGDAKTQDGGRVLFIDEIQSKRHQEGREKGYYGGPDQKLMLKAFHKAIDDYNNYLKEIGVERTGRDILSKKERNALNLTEEQAAKLEELESAFEEAREKYIDSFSDRGRGGIPAAPFEKNWHELAMKRMLRYAAENGYDSVAWTTGDQQAERYNIGGIVPDIDVSKPNPDSEYSYKVLRFNANGDGCRVDVDKDGKITLAEGIGQDAVGKSLGEVFGKELAVKIMEGDHGKRIKLDENTRVGGEGMRGFYDEMLPRFVDKYAKKWNTKTSDQQVTLSDGSMIDAHVLPVTQEMKESVMNGQLMFSRSDEAVEQARSGGIAAVLGGENVGPFYGDIYKAIPKELRASVVDRAMNNGLNFREAMAERLSEVARGGYENDDSGLLLLAETVLSYYNGESIRPNAVRYILMRGERGVNDNDILEVAQDIALRRRLQIGVYAEQMRFSKGDLSQSLNQADKTAEVTVDNAKAEVDAQKKSLKGNLLTIAKAMRAQKEYDLRTIDAITNLARQLLKEQGIDSLGKREVSRLLGIVKYSAGKSPKTVKKYADALVEMVIEHLLRSERARIAELTKITGTKVNASGVQVQGALDIMGQKALKQYKESIKSVPYTKDENGEKQIDTSDIDADLDEAHTDLDSKDDAIRKDAEARIQGLTLAKQYLQTVQDLLDQESGLEKSKDVAKKEYKDGKIPKTAYDQAIKEIDDSLRQNHIEQVEALRDHIEQLQGVITGSVALKEDAVEREKDRVKAIRHLANSDMQGIPTDEPGPNDHILNKGFFQTILGPMGTFVQFFRLFGRKSSDGQGYLYNKFVRQQREAQDREFAGIASAMNELDEKVSEIFGKKMTYNDLYAEARAIDRSHEPVKVKHLYREGMKEREKSQSQLLYIYMVNKMGDGRMKLRRMGITEEEVERITAEIDPRFIQFADWVQGEFLTKLRNKYNAVHERVFGASMAAIENYFPLRIEKGDINKKEDINQSENEPQYAATTTGAVIKRTKNNRALDLVNADAFTILADHVKEMEHWSAFAEFNKDTNTLISYRRFHNQVASMKTIFGTGEVLWDNFKKVLRIANGAYRPKRSKADQFFTNLVRAVSLAKVNFRINTAIKQLASFTAFIPDMSIKNMASAMKNPIETWKWAMEELPSFKARWNLQNAGDEKLLPTDSDYKLWTRKTVQWLSQNGMLPNRFVDAVTVSIGARAIYLTKKEGYLRDGYSEEEADKRAKQDCEIAFNETQQSSEGAFLSAMQRDRDFISTSLTTFRNGPFGYTRKAVGAIRSLARMNSIGKDDMVAFMTKQFVRDGLSQEQAAAAAERKYNKDRIRHLVTIATSFWINTLAWNIFGHLWYYLFGDDDDLKYKYLKEDALRALIGGPFEGFAGGNYVSDAIGGIISGDYFSPDLNPLISDIESLRRTMKNDWVAGTNDFVNLAAQAIVGVNPQTFTDIAVAIVDACNGDLELSKEALLLIMRVMQVPQSQIDQIYIDELGTNAAEARQMSYSEMASRYAEYKINRSAPLTKWAYDDKTLRKKRKGKEKTFKNKVNERKEIDND